MKPTLGIVSFLLSGEYEIVAGFRVEDDVEFDRHVIYGGERPESGVLYLVDAPVGADLAWRGKLFLGLSDRTGEDAVAPGEYHVVVRERNAKKRKRSKEARFLDLVNAVNCAVRKFDSWAMDLQQCCLGAPDFREMLAILEQEMGLVSVLVSRNLRYLAASEGFAGVNSWFDGSDTSMDVDMANRLMADDAFRNAISQKAAFYYHYNEEGADAYSACYNVVSTGRYEARLLIQHPAGGRMYGQLTFAAYVGELVDSAFARYLAAETGDSANLEFHQALLEIAQGSVVKTDSLRDVLAMRGWGINDPLIAHAFMFIEPENESLTRRYYQDRISHLFAGCAVFQYDGTLYCVRNLNLEQRTVDEASQDLILFLRENLCHAGTSREFRDVRRLPAFLAEARVALRLGEASRTMQWHFRFEDYALSYIYNQAQRDFSWEELVHPAFDKLRIYDEQHGTELLETARCFMECRYKISWAAEALHVHRSSLLARLDRIDKVAAIDWDSWDDRVHLALSFGLARQR